MSGRGTLFDEGPTACPFVALENDRDRRSAEPDPRHRCYAEPTPAPRALAHQREFCLSPTFGGCPIFQDWAVRAAARPVPLRPPPEWPRQEQDHAASQQLPVLAPPPIEAPSAEGPPPQPAGADRVERVASLPLDDDSGQLTGAEDAVSSEPASDELADDSTSRHDVVGGGSAGPESDDPASRRRRWVEDWPPAAAAAGAGGEIDAFGPSSGNSTQLGSPDEAPLPDFLSGRDTGSGSSTVARPAELPRRVDYAQRPEPALKPQPRPRAPSRQDLAAQREDIVPSWQRDRHAAYSTLGTRIRLGDGDSILRRLTRIFGIAAAIALLAALLIVLAPNFLGGIAVPDQPTPSPTPRVTAAPTTPPTPSPTPEPTTVTHTIAPGDTLFGIAVRYEVTVEQILAANPQVTNPNLIQVGQVITIPPPDFPVATPRATPAD
ncbi:MAG TPA: LysM domain-containing protein [Candidatus Limnocylindrales bacterium]|nr:LysM domain-containing protein [Candidatus Limnocylindrales bacterium]